MLGIRLPVVGSVLQVVVTKSRPAVLPQLVQHIARRLTLKQTTAGTFLIGGGSSRVDIAGGGRWRPR